MLDRYLEETEKAAPDYQKCLKTMTEAISDFRENWYNNDKELYQILILLDIFRILDSKSINPQIRAERRRRQRAYPFPNPTQG